MTILCPESVRILASFFVNILPLVRVSWQQSGLAICVDLINPQKPNRRRAFSTILRQIRKSPGLDWQDPPNRATFSAPGCQPLRHHWIIKSNDRVAGRKIETRSSRAVGAANPFFTTPKRGRRSIPPVKITCRLEARLPISDKIPPTKTKTVSLSLVTNDSHLIRHDRLPFAVVIAKRTHVVNSN